MKMLIAKYCWYCGRRTDDGRILCYRCIEEIRD